MTTPTPAPKRRGRPPGATLAQAHPEIAAQLVDQSLADVLSRGTDRRVEWQCRLGHRWEATVCNRTNTKNKTGCPFCDGKRVWPGFNDIATTHPNEAALFDDPSLVTTTTAFSNKPVLLRCAVDTEHTWKAPPHRLTSQGSRCPYCSGRSAIIGGNDLATTHPHLAAELVDPSLATGLKAGSSQRETLWSCDDPKHDPWSATPYSRTARSTGCPQCSGRIVVPGVNDLLTTHPWLAAQLKDPSIATKIGKGYDNDVEWVCTNEPAHVWSASPTNRVKGVGCRFCSNRQVLTGFNDLATTAPELLDRLVDPSDALRVTAGTATKLAWKCAHDSTHVWEAEPYRLLSPRPAGCSLCFRQHRSAPESALVQILRTLLPKEKILTSQRGILPSGRELDIVVPSKNLAIEFNGVYWHSEAVLDDPGYHWAKSTEARKVGLRLVHVWEDNWFDRPALVVRALTHRLGASDKALDVLPGADPRIAQRLYARSLTLDEATPQEARTFWTANHLQGPVGCRYNLALRDDDGAMRALLGVGTRNHGSRARAQPGTWDVQRYATLGSVPGGFTRLLAHARKTLLATGHQVSRWTSYSDDDVSDGGMYLAAGFVADKHQRPSYSYIAARTGWRRAHRSNFTRQRFERDPDLAYQQGWTEHEAALANGLLRVYDAGKTRWVQDVN